MHWNVAGQVSLADVLAIGFIISFCADRIARGDARLPRTSFVAIAFLVAFLVVYLVGYFNIDTAAAAAQYAKGMTKFAIHFLFLIAGVAYLARCARTFYWQAFGVFTAGMVFNAAYGLLELLAARSGRDIDKALLSPITGGASSINIYGAIEGANIYRPNALTGDPNHLGVMLVIPLIALLPVYLRLERGHRWKVPLAITLALPVPRRADDALAQRPARADRRPARARAPLPPAVLHARVPRAARVASSACSGSSSCRGSTTSSA